MQRYIAHAATEVGRVMPFGWNRTAPTRSLPYAQRQAEDAGVGFEDGRLHMALGPDMANLLGIRPGQVFRRDADDAAAEDGEMYTGEEPADEPADFSERGAAQFDDGVDLLDRRTEQVRTWLRSADAHERLQARGLTVDDVELQLQYNSGRAIKIIQQAAMQEQAAFALVPTADYLFATSVRDADMAALLSPRPVAVTTTAAATTVTEPTTTSSTTTAAPATTSDPLVDMALRGQALGILQKFQDNYFRLLPQLYEPSHVHVLSTLIGGEVVYTDARLLAATFPCALSLDFSRSSQRLVARYPQGTRKGTHVHRAELRGDETLVARDIGSYKVRISTDRRHWQTLQIYTDDVVEATKLRTWQSILEAVGKVYRHALAHTVAWHP